MIWEGRVESANGASRRQVEALGCGDVSANSRDSNSKGCQGLTEACSSRSYSYITYTL